jgi:3-hydroxyisobutyrate dehydrogenase-like beta-hydroxyacid dehydrogenase
VLDAYAKMCALIGGPGSGQLTKMVNQVAIVGLLQGLSGGAQFRTQGGLDMEKVVAVISKGAAQSWQLENRWKTMVEGKFEGLRLCRPTGCARISTSRSPRRRRTAPTCRALR